MRLARREPRHQQVMRRRLTPNGAHENANVGDSRLKQRVCRRVRHVKPGDCAALAKWMSEELPFPGKLARALPALLEQLVADETLRGSAVEDCRDGAPPQLMAFGLSSFLHDALVQEYLGQPFPHLEIVLLERVWKGAAGQGFLGHEAVAAANAGCGATLFPLMWLQRSNDPSDEDARQLLHLCQQVFLATHSGYRINRILKEACESRADAFRRAGFREAHVLRAGTRLPFSRQTLNRDHIVFVASRTDYEKGWPGAVLDPLFMYRQPKCAFTRAEQRVLQRAEQDLTDAEIAQDLGIAVTAVSMRWRSIYARVAARVPGVLGADGPSGAEAARGAEKRRRVVAYVRQHPEELRPFAW